MKDKIVRKDEIEVETLDWGTLGWISTPSRTGTANITSIEVTVLPGKGHDFHKHPDQEEFILIKNGRLEVWLEKESAILNAGDSILVDAGVVHASFNTSDEPVDVFVVLSPCVGESGYELVEVAEEEPWASLR